MKVFVSSTIYDLIDIRAELKNMFDTLDINSYFSEIGTSDFAIDFSTSSIESCLYNIEIADYFIIIIDRRYSHTLEKYGYDELSATHLEYKHAKLCSKKILFFIRENTYTEYSLYKKLDKKTTFKGCWIQDKDIHVFSLIEEHITLRDKDNNNWFYLFKTSCDLKDIISKYLQKPLIEENIPKLIGKNELPNLVLSYKTNMSLQKNGNYLLEFNGNVKNHGNTTAFIQNLNLNEESTPVGLTLSPGESLDVGFVIKNFTSIKRKLFLKYTTYDGIQISQTYDIILCQDDSFIKGGLNIIINPSIKDYRITDKISIKINT